jgi:Carbohydrate esterase 2 N-terminal/GDSL-like Lipase/Acylhydrolase family
MKHLITYLALATCFLYNSCSSSRRNTTSTVVELPATSLRPFGRYDVSTGKGLELIGSAVHFGFTFKGTSCKIYTYLPATNGHNYLQYTLDSTYQQKIRIEDARQPLLITAPNGGEHTIRIYKTTEATTGPVFIQKIEGDDLKALTEPKAKLIEFIGNSITCGAAADPSQVPCGTGEYLDQHDAYDAYGPRVARALGVNFVMSCVSGIGVYRNWNSDGPTMPQVYEKTDLQLNSSRNWDFTKYIPGVVSIALGTNDFSNGDGKKPRLPFDSAVFVSNYIDFVKLVKSKYPAATIALLSSPMVHDDKRIVLQNCITAVQQNIDAAYPNDKPVATFFFEPMQAHGCAGHPNVQDHSILANELIPFFRKLLNLRTSGPQIN